MEYSQKPLVAYIDPSPHTIKTMQRRFTGAQANLEFIFFSMPDKICYFQSLRKLKERRADLSIIVAYGGKWKYPEHYEGIKEVASGKDGQNFIPFKPAVKKTSSLVMVNEDPLLYDDYLDLSVKVYNYLEELRNEKKESARSSVRPVRRL